MTLHEEDLYQMIRDLQEKVSQLETAVDEADWRTASIESRLEAAGIAGE